MTVQAASRYAILGLVLTAGPALAGDAVPDYLNAPGIGVVADIGNNRAADVPMFDTNENPKPLWVYDVDLGKHVLREGAVDTRAADTRAVDTREAEAAQTEGAELDFGTDIH